MSNTFNYNPQTVLCIPGKWADKSAIITAVISSSQNQFTFTDETNNVLQNLKTKEKFQFIIADRAQGLRETFDRAGKFDEYAWVTDEFLEEIAAHTYIVYIVGPTGNLKKAKSIAQAANAVLNAGGIGVKVETAEKAFSKGHWQAIVQSIANGSITEDAELYRMYVHETVTDGKGTVWSRGMHNLGFKDAIVSGLQHEDALELISLFNQFQVFDNLQLEVGFPFTIQLGDDPEQLTFYINEEPNQPHRGDELFENPYGMWILIPENDYDDWGQND